MSTYYYFKCKNCGKYGGFFSRQAWGWGNFDIIDSFRFLAKHIASCGHREIVIVNEHDDLPLEEEDKELPLTVFPLSGDWSRNEEKFQEYAKHKRIERAEENRVLKSLTDK